MNKILRLFPLLFLTYCSVYEQIADGTQKIQVRIWKDFNPDITGTSANNVWTVNTAEEQVVEFDSYITNDTIYVAYTTTQSICTIKNPAKNSISAEILGTNNAGKANEMMDNTILYQLENNGEVIKTFYVTTNTTKGSTGTTSTKPITNAKACQSSRLYKGEKGVWVRVLKGTRSGIDKNPQIHWTLELATSNSMDISDIKIISLPGKEGSILAVSNKNKAIIITQDSGKEGVAFFSKNLFTQRTPQRISQLNTWIDDDSVFVAGMLDNSLITGYFIGTAWYETYFAKWSDPVDQFDVAMGADHAYAIWLDQSKNVVQLGAYFPERSQTDRWMLLDSVRSVKLPQLAITRFLDEKGVRQESAYVGTVNKNKSFFQLNIIQNAQLYFDGPIISDWNERYSFASNNRHQVLYARVDFDQNLIFAGLNSLKQWEPIRISRPPKVKVHPSSKLQVKFMEGKFPYIIFKQQDGTIYVLEGVS